MFMLNGENKYSKVRKRAKFEDDDSGEVGIVHYRSFGGLRSPPGYSPKHKRLKSVREPITLTEGSLFNMCLKFMTQNLDLLDSLVGLPEYIGEKLFKYMIKEEVLYLQFDSTYNYNANSKLKFKVLGLFDDAFNELLLRSLSFEKVPEKIDVTPFLHSFKNLVELDLSGRALPDETLNCLSRLSCLEKLLLRRNKLSDESITKLTRPYRVFKDNLQEVEILDFSNNPGITNSSLECLLMAYAKLKTFCLTNTGVKMNRNLVYELKQYGWDRSHDEYVWGTATEGWAEPIITHMCKEAKVLEPSKASKFYSKQKKVNTGDDASDDDKLTANKGTLILTRSSIVLNIPRFSKEALIYNENNLSRRKVFTKKTAKLESNVSLNNQLRSIFSEDDNENDILQQYTSQVNKYV